MQNKKKEWKNNSFFDKLADDDEEHKMMVEKSLKRLLENGEIIKSFDVEKNDWVYKKVEHSDEVVINDRDGNEIVKWVRKEWEDDPSILPSISNAIKLSYEGKYDEIKHLIGVKNYG